MKSGHGHLHGSIAFFMRYLESFFCLILFRLGEFPGSCSQVFHLGELSVKDVTSLSHSNLHAKSYVVDPRGLTHIKKLKLFDSLLYELILVIALWLMTAPCLMTALCLVTALYLVITMPTPSRPLLREDTPVLWLLFALISVTTPGPPGLTTVSTRGTVAQ